MKAALMMKRVTGTYVESTTLGEVVKAFVPHALPPQKPGIEVDQFCETGSWER